MPMLLPMLFWVLAILVVGTIFFGALYLVVRAAVRDGIRLASAPATRLASSVEE